MNITLQIESGYHRQWVLILGSLTLLFGAILFCFDPTHYNIYPQCAFYQVTGLLCPGCGALRAGHQLLHGHLLTAFRFNPLLVTYIPVVAALYLRYLVRSSNGQSRPIAFPMHLVWLLGVGALALGVWRNLPGAPVAILPP
ncbi:MAG TPA: DUF2752 domain-containing protein [Candidatus Limnocylindrales bacterium]|nr:DUF2752 domain-containing protein [Candidatus Limnocylindrales bacterium]